MAGGKLFNSLIGKVFGGIDLNKMTEDARSGKMDPNKMMGMLSKLLGKETSDKLIAAIQQKVKNGEKVNMSMVQELLKDPAIMDKVDETAKSGNVKIEELQDTLTDMVGEKQSQKFVDM